MILKITRMVISVLLAILSLISLIMLVLFFFEKMALGTFVSLFLLLIFSCISILTFPFKEAIKRKINKNNSIDVDEKEDNVKTDDFKNENIKEKRTIIREKETLAIKKEIDTMPELSPEIDNKVKFCKYCGEKIYIDSKFCTKCGNRVDLISTNFSPNIIRNEYIINTKQKKHYGCGCLFGIIMSILSLVACVFFIGIEDEFIQKTMSGVKSKQEYITLEEFNKIKTGMTYKQVAEIIGGDGNLSIDSGNNKHTMKMYTWYGNGMAGSSASIVFTNGGVSTKGQFGLK